MCSLARLIHGKRLLLLLFLLALVLLAMVQRPASAEQVIYVPQDSELDWVLKLNDSPWSDSAIFKAMTALIMEQTTPMASLCDPTFDSDTATKLGFSAIVWHPVDYIEHLVFIQTYYIDIHARTIMPAGGTDNETWARLEREFWDEFSEGILDVFARGDAVMEMTNVDVDKDGAIETLFRLPWITPHTLVEGSNRRPEIGTVWDVVNCLGGPPDTPIYHAMLSPDSVESLSTYGERLSSALERLPSLLLFRFDGRIHGVTTSGRGGGVVDIVRKHDHASVTNSLWQGYITLRSALNADETVTEWHAP